MSVFYDRDQATDNPINSIDIPPLWEPEDLLPDADNNDRGAPVDVQNDYLFTVERAANSGSTGQTDVGQNGQRRVPIVVGAQAARRSITLVNVGTVEVQYGYTESLTWGQGFPIAVGGGVTRAYRGPIYATVAAVDGTAPGRLAWDALHEDG